jgi:hypothetical protein
MGGPRANYILVEDSETYVIQGKYSGAEIPQTLTMGANDYLNWFHECINRGSGIDQPYDTFYTEGGLLVNVDQKTVLAGFHRWYPEMYLEAFDAAPECYRIFHRHQNLRQIFLDLIQPVWPGYQILFAELPTFAVQECIEPDPIYVSLIEAGPKTRVREQDAQIRRTFIRLLTSCLNPSPSGQAALNRLQL